MKCHSKSFKTVSLLAFILSSYAAHADQVYDGSVVLTTTPPYETEKSPVTAGYLEISGSAAEAMFNSLQQSTGIVPPPAPLNHTETGGTTGSGNGSGSMGFSETRFGENYHCTLTFTSSCPKSAPLCPGALVPNYSCSIIINNLGTGSISSLPPPPVPVPGPAPTATPVPAPAPISNK